MSDYDYKPDSVIAKALDNIKPSTIKVTAPTDQMAQVMLVPKGMEAHSMKKYLDENRKVPERREGVEQADRLESFIAMTNRFKSDDSVVFAKGEIDENSITAHLTAVLDFHPEGPDNTSALNKGHLVFYNFPVSKEFGFWLGSNGKPLQQTDFALLLEERVGEMSAPSFDDFPELNGLKPKFADPLEILSLSRDLEIYSSEEVKQAGKLASGEREIKFTAVHNDADGKPVSIPDFFILNIPIFAGGMPVKIPVRLRYRKKDTGVIWFYDLYRIDRVFEEAFDRSVDIVKSETGIPLFMGSTHSKHLS